MKRYALVDRVLNLEAKFAAHLEESGAIRADLAWVKKSIWLGVAAGGTAAAGVLVQLFLMIVKGH
jgi:hypothetical protein